MLAVLINLIWIYSGLLPLHLVLDFFLTVDLIQAFCQHWKERLTDDYHVLFYFGVRVEVEDANERIFLWGQMQTGDFSFGVRIGVEDAKSLDLLHGFSLSVQICLSFFLRSS